MQPINKSRIGNRIAWMPPESSLPDHGDGSRLSNVAQRLLDEVRPRAKSLAVTILGDSLAPHGGESA
jgi:hypothetical protein